MAFGGIALSFVLFILLVVTVCWMFLGGILLLTLCTVFAVLYGKQKKRGTPKKWMKIVSIISGVLGIIGIAPLSAYLINTILH